MSDAVYNTMNKNKWRKFYYISGLYSSDSEFFFLVIISLCSILQQKMFLQLPLNTRIKGKNIQSCILAQASMIMTKYKDH